MTILYVVISVVAVIVLLPLLRNWRKSRRDYKALRETVHGEKDHYAFLIDRDFKVKETNFYELNPELRDGQPDVLGNVLHCETGCESGPCGTGIACSTCPVRLIVNNSFKQRRNFSDVTATMHLLNKEQESQEVNVKVDGRLVYLGYKPHFLVSVRQ